MSKSLEPYVYMMMRDPNLVIRDEAHAKQLIKARAQELGIDSLFAERFDNFGEWKLLAEKCTNRK